MSDRETRRAEASQRAFEQGMADAPAIRAAYGLETPPTDQQTLDRLYDILNNLNFPRRWFPELEDDG